MKDVLLSVGMVSAAEDLKLPVLLVEEFVLVSFRSLFRGVMGDR